jgi:ADP-heptose:LPS heptosyltransferase
MKLHSLPDYKWPESHTRWTAVPRRLAGAIAFHVAYWSGRVTDWLAGPARPAIAVIRTDGLGDAVLFEPALRSLAARFPEHDLHLWAPAAVCDLYGSAPYVAQLTVIPRGCKPGNLEYFASLKWRACMGYAIGRHPFDTAVCPAESPEPLGNWLLASVRADERWMVDGDTENQFQWQKARAIMAATGILSHRPGGGHELLRNAHLAKQWKSPTDIAGDLPQIHVSDDAAQVAFGLVRQWRALARQLDAVGILGVVPAGTLTAKSYRPAAWATVLAQLWQEHRLLPAFIGTANEAGPIEEILGRLPEMPYLRLGDAIDVLALAALLGKLDVVLGVDTGPAHLALAQQVPTVVLCGGGYPGRFFPWPDARDAIVLNHRMPCEGCASRCHLAEPECVTSISPADVVNAVLAVWRGRQDRDKPVQPPRPGEPMRVAV